MAIKKHERSRLEKAVRFLKFRVLHVNDSPKRIALGVSWGLLVAWTPILGVHIVMALFLAIITRANKLVALVAVWVSNPFTYIPMWSVGYMLGKVIMGLFNSDNVEKAGDISQQVSNFSISEFFTRCFELEFWKEMVSSIISKGPELWLGSLIIGVISAIAGYFITYYLILRHRQKNPHRRFRKHL